MLVENFWNDFYNLFGIKKNTNTGPANMAHGLRVKEGLAVF